MGCLVFWVWGMEENWDYLALANMYHCIPATTGRAKDDVTIVGSRIRNRMTGTEVRNLAGLHTALASR